MKILVCISVVPDTTSKITIDSSNLRVSTNGITNIVGPYDDYALSRALEIKEMFSSEVVIFHVGGAESEPLIRKCLALGADYAVRIDGNPTDSYQIAKEISDYVKENHFDLILMGKESIDYNSGLVHGIVAGMLNFNHFSPVMHLDIENEKLKIEVEIDGGKASIECPLPAVLGCQEPIAEWKIPNMRGIMAARTKEIKELNMSSQSSSKILSEEIIDTERKQIQIPADNLELLVEYLKSEITF